MIARIAIVLAGMALSLPVLTLPVLAEELTPEKARHFVVGKMFSFQCFEGSAGMGRVHPDGSVSGSIRFGGSGPVRYVTLPPGTLRVKGESVCASLKGMFFEPCFNLEKTDDHSFRGSLSGFSFASCQFTRRNGRPEIIRTSTGPLSLRSTISANE
ncbi:MAG TPA: hypothetical protein VHN11_19365 [Xanthobacteraceae bacterium]|jgi:hypothetical protein|nr:hypothetical protein [Xanthobacteraceae bacterium]